MGEKSTATLQVLPKASVPGEPAPLAVTGQAFVLSSVKFVEITGLLPLPGTVKLSAALPRFQRLAEMGLLLLPEVVEGKLKDGGSDTSSFTAFWLLVLPM